MGAGLISRAGEERGGASVGEEANLGRGSRNTMPLATPSDLETKDPKPTVNAAAAEFGDTFFLERATEGCPQRDRMKTGEGLLGRDPWADTRLVSPEVSRRPSLFAASVGRPTVRDSGSRNQTMVGGRPTEEDTVLKPGQDLRPGALTARVLNTDGWED